MIPAGPGRLFFQSLVRPAIVRWLWQVRLLTVVADSGSHVPHASELCGTVPALLDFSSRARRDARNTTKICRYGKGRKKNQYEVRAKSSVNVSDAWCSYSCNALQAVPEGKSVPERPELLPMTSTVKCIAASGRRITCEEEEGYDDPDSYKVDETQPTKQPTNSRIRFRQLGRLQYYFSKNDEFL